MAISINSITAVKKIIYPVKYKEYVVKYSVRNNVDTYLVFAIIKAESSFNPDATSGKNARGLMQITVDTGTWAAEKIKMGEIDEDDLYDPETNIRIGSWYIWELIKEFNNRDLAIAAYNGGRGNVKKWLGDKRYSSNGRTLDKIPFKETDRFLKRVKKFYNNYKSLYESKF